MDECRELPLDTGLHYVTMELQRTGDKLPERNNKNMIATIRKFFTQTIAIGVASGSTTNAQRYCSFDCYDDGGCDQCSEWVEWMDEDYGLVGDYRLKPKHNNW